MVALVQRCMEEAAKLDLPLPVSVQVGERIGSLQPYSPGGGAESVRPTAAAPPGHSRRVCLPISAHAQSHAVRIRCRHRTTNVKTFSTRPVGWPTAMAPGCASVGTHYHYHYLD